jgi:hypothetical protein
MPENESMTNQSDDSNVVEFGSTRSKESPRRDSTQETKVAPGIKVTPAPPAEFVKISKLQLEHFLHMEREFNRLNEIINKVASYIVNNYPDEIDSGEPQHKGTTEDCIVYYLAKERRRIGVQVRYTLRSIRRLGGGK